MSAENNIANHILPTSATMTGVCVTVISIVRLTEATRHISTVIDTVFAMTGLVFLLSCFLSYTSMRKQRFGGVLEKYADLFFMIGLSMTVLGGFMLALEVEHF
ncbi:MAG: hypothetical protein HKL98_12965 [Burkholderiales bacterium]|nr:hypothetical protein [Burkholderiales bacterium]